MKTRNWEPQNFKEAPPLVDDSSVYFLLNPVITRTLSSIQPGRLFFYLLCCLFVIPSCYPTNWIPLSDNILLQSGYYIKSQKNRGAFGLSTRKNEFEYRIHQNNLILTCRITSGLNEGLLADSLLIKIDEEIYALAFDEVKSFDYFFDETITESSSETNSRTTVTPGKEEVTQTKEGEKKRVIHPPTTQTEQTNTEESTTIRTQEDQYRNEGVIVLPSVLVEKLKTVKDLQYKMTFGYTEVAFKASYSKLTSIRNWLKKQKPIAYR